MQAWLTGSVSSFIKLVNIWSPVLLLVPLFINLANAADGIVFPKTIAWSAYQTGTGGYSKAVQSAIFCSVSIRLTSGLFQAVTMFRGLLLCELDEYIFRQVDLKPSMLKKEFSTSLPRSGDRNLSVC